MREEKAEEYAFCTYWKICHGEDGHRLNKNSYLRAHSIVIQHKIKHYKMQKNTSIFNIILIWLISPTI